MEKQKKEEETKSGVLKGVAGLALLSLLFWPKKKAISFQKAELKKASHSVPRSTNQTGRLEEA